MLSMSISGDGTGAPLSAAISEAGSEIAASLRAVAEALEAIASKMPSGEA
jgi:hypothetical protein